MSYKELLAGKACEGGALYADTHKCYRKTGTDVVTRREGPIGPRVCVEGGGRGGEAPFQLLLGNAVLVIQYV